MISDLQDLPSLSKKQHSVSNRIQPVSLLPRTKSVVARTRVLKTTYQRKSAPEYPVIFPSYTRTPKIYQLACELGQSPKHCLAESDRTFMLRCRRAPRVYVDAYGLSDIYIYIYIYT
jgi:hypothetical protein